MSLNSGNNGEFINNAGKGMFWMFGGKNFEVYNIFLAVILPVIRICSIGAKLYLRKGMQVGAVNPLFLIIHFLAVYGSVFGLKLSSSQIQTDNFITSFQEENPFVFYYLVGLAILAVIHYIYFRLDREVSYDSGFGIVHIFWNGGEGQKRNLRLIDPLLLAIGAGFFFTFEDGKSLAYILWASSLCLLIEEALLMYRDWNRLLKLRDAEIEAEKLGKKLNRQHDNGDEPSYRARSAKDQ